MKYILLAASLLIPQAITATNYPLSPESKQFITNWALVGGIIGAGIGIVATDDIEKVESKKKNKLSPWARVGAILVSASLGALTAGFIASFFTTEEYLKSGQKELAMLENNALLDKAMHTNDATQLKRMAYNSRYPTLTTYERLEALLAKIKQAQEYLFTVIKSGSSSLGSIAQAALERLKVMEQRIIDWMSKLKDNQYLNEFRMRADDEYKKQMVEANYRIAAAAEAQARAAQSAAHAAWHQVHHARPVYVAPPAVNVYVKK